MFAILNARRTDELFSSAITFILAQHRRAHTQRAIEKRERVLLSFRRIIEPVKQRSHVIDPKDFRGEKAQRVLFLWQRFLDEFFDEPEIPMAQLHRAMTERSQGRGRLQRM